MKSFLTACGVDDSLQLIVESQSANEGELRLLHQPFAVIGRDPRVDMVLDHSQVSRRHVYLQMVEGRAFWVDLESRTGTRGEGSLRRFGWLDGGQALCVGPYVIRRFVGDSQTGNVHSKRTASRHAFGCFGLQPCAVTRSCLGVSQWPVAVDVQAGAPGNVIDRIGQRL